MFMHIWESFATGGRQKVDREEKGVYVMSWELVW